MIENYFIDYKKLSSFEIILYKRHLLDGRN